MKIERISDNQIRCTLNKEDLVGQEMLLNELAFSPDKAKGLFRDLMQKAAVEVGFDTEDEPIMIEAIPVNKDCLVLVITKVDEQENMSDGFQQFAKRISKDVSRFSIDDDTDLSSASSKTFATFESTMTDVMTDSGMEVYCFDSLDGASDACKRISSFEAEGALYKDPMNSCYYLSITMPVATNRKAEFEQIHTILREHCRRMPNTYATKSFFKEHLTPIIKNDAITVLADY